MDLKYIGDSQFRLVDRDRVEAKAQYFLLPDCFSFRLSNRVKPRNVIVTFYLLLHRKFISSHIMN